MVQLLVIGGLLFIIYRLISSWSQVDHDPQEEYVLRGLAFAVFAVGAFSVGGWLMKLLFSSLLDYSLTALGEWVIAGLLVLLFLDQSNARKIMRETSRVVTVDYIRGSGKLSQKEMIIRKGEWL